MLVYYGRRHGFLYWLLIGWWLWLILLPFKIMWAVFKAFPKACLMIGSVALCIGAGGLIFVLFGGLIAILIAGGLIYGLVKLFHIHKHRGMI